MCRGSRKRRKQSTVVVSILQRQVQRHYDHRLRSSRHLAAIFDFGTRRSRPTSISAHRLRPMFCIQFSLPSSKYLNIINNLKLGIIRLNWLFQFKIKIIIAFNQKNAVIRGFEPISSVTASPTDGTICVMMSSLPRV